MSDKKSWASEPTPLCDECEYSVYDADGTGSHAVVSRNTARDLERQLRLCRKHLKWVSRCATMAGPAGTRLVFIDKGRMNKIKALVKRMEQDGEIPLE